MPRYQDSFAREAIWCTYHDFQPCPETIKSTILVPEQQHVNMSRKHLIYYTKAIFAWCQSHPNSDILAPRITKKAAKQLSWCQAGAKMLRYQPRWCQDIETGPKIAATQQPSWCPSWCQDAKISRFPSRARPFAPLTPTHPPCLKP